MKSIIIPRLEIGSAGSCGGSQKGVQPMGNNDYWDLGWRKKRETARKAALKIIKSIVEN